MEAALLFYLNSSDSEEDEKIIRKQLRDRSNPLALSNTAFVKRFRLTKEAFIYVLEQINLKHMDAKVVAPLLQLVTTLSVLATGGYQHSEGMTTLLEWARALFLKSRQRFWRKWKGNCAQSIYNSCLMSRLHARNGSMRSIKSLEKRSRRVH